MKVLYIGGTGRTGSTLLDRLLGSAPGWLSGGELAFLWRFGLTRSGLCSCGAPVADCPVWSEALAATNAEVPFDAERMVRLRRRFRSEHMPLMASRRFTERRLDSLEEFPAVVERLYRAVCDVTGSRVLIDSSKEPHYSSILRRRTGLDIYFLHLVRDPRAVGYSWTRKRAETGFAGSEDMARRGVLKSSLYYNVSNVGAERLWRDEPDRYRILRYEDFVADPGGVAARIADFVGEELDLGGVLAGDTFMPRAAHVTWGNPNRFDVGETTISRDDAWRGKQARWRSAVLGAINAPTASRYGYPLRAGGSLRDMKHPERDIRSVAGVTGGGGSR